MYETVNVVQKIKTLSKKQGIKITELLEKCELSKNALSSMNSRGSWIQANSLAKIADYLGCSVDYLLGRTDKPEGIETALSVSGNQQTNISGNNSINVSTEQARELDNEFSTLLLRLSLRERVELMSMIYKYVDEHAEK